MFPEIPTLALGLEIREETPMDALTLARAQFGFTIAFHYIFPPFSIGLGLILVFIEGFYFFTKKTLYLEMAKFWSRIFGLVFAIGVATGIVMEFQFGTNWSNYSRFVGDVFGSALAAEGVFAFFLNQVSWLFFFLGGTGWGGGPIFFPLSWSALGPISAPFGSSSLIPGNKPRRVIIWLGKG